ncbi:hypothetical protein LSUE1_G002306 [Lachnellula suecica]|uniref:Uncharacterized protein n=1 Tax=Lachnellula suecica TaxID=602035 RepID=A0A8T9C7H8_9HELO|nr:hypothetical protein LSUE1_G002306 [Lachnellula suecica]
MQYSFAFLALVSATSVAALPLNINLGAYSPALVVGDGEISFGGAESATNLVEALSGASAGTETAATGLTRAAAEAAAPAKVATPTPAVVENPTPVVITPSGSVTSTPTGQGIGRDLSGDLAPREPEPQPEDPASEVQKRDLAGFNAALNFAAGALTTSPGVQLGTGEGGAGVGIIVEPGAKSGVAAKVAKRDDGSLPTVTLLKIRSLGGSDAAKVRRVARGVQEREIGVDGVESDDGVDLNLDGDIELIIAEIKP